MSSSSSSECLCPDCFRYGNIKCGATAPFYRTMGHPLIYYAQVEPPFFNRRGRGSKDDNPNCFVKAFRWYTQEHYSQKAEPQCDQECANRGELSGFATWLDRKYDQYLKDKGFQEFTRIDSTTPCTADKPDTREPCEVYCKKPCSRPVSPWGKRWRQVKSKEQGCTLQKSHQSCEYILEPKDLSRATSDCCQQLSVSNRSELVTAASSDTQTSKKTVVKSNSAGKNELQKRICNILNSKGKCEGDIVVKNSMKPRTIKNKSLSDKTVKRTADVACQCPGEENCWTCDAQTQYETHDFKEIGDCQPTCDYTPPPPSIPPPPPPTPTCIIETKSSTIYNPPALCPCEKKPSKPKPSTTNVVRIESTASCQCRLQPRPKVSVASQYHRTHREYDCQCAKESEKSPTKTIKIPQPQKLERPCINCNCLPRIPQKSPIVLMDPPKFDDIKPICTNYGILTSKINDGAAQTSDHSIDLEAACNRKYPFFMKIVCADKLKEEYAHK